MAHGTEGCIWIAELTGVDDLYSDTRVEKATAQRISAGFVEPFRRS